MKFLHFKTIKKKLFHEIVKHKRHLTVRLLKEIDNKDNIKKN